MSSLRERHGTSGAKSDPGDAHALADMVRTDSHQLREFFPAALEAFGDLAAPDLLAKAPGPASAARLSKAQVTAAAVVAALRSP